MSEKTSGKLHTAARVGANALPIYRCYAGYRTRQALGNEMQDPAARTWAFAARVATDVATDKLDGILARYAGTTRWGGYLDQLADKLWFLTIAHQLAENGEIKNEAFTIPRARDVGVTAVRPIAQIFGLNSDARISGKMKLVTQAGAVVAACSPLAHEHPALIEGMFDVATGVSVLSGLETMQSYATQLAEQYGKSPEPAAKLIVASTTEIALLSRAA